MSSPFLFGAAPLAAALLALGCTPAVVVARPALPASPGGDQSLVDGEGPARALVEVPYEPGPVERVGRGASRLSAIVEGPLPLGSAPATTRMILDGGRMGHDPQVAVGERFVFVYTAHRYQLHDKATGKRLAAAPGNEIAPVGDFGTLFAPLWAPLDKHGNPNAASVNRRLRFTPGDPLACDESDPLGSRACVQEFYDSRIQWDATRKRFWVESAARNHLWSCTPSDKEPCTDPKFSASQFRRYIAIAVSRTEDPRDGFHRYILVDEYSDWPKIAIHERYLVLAHRASPQLYLFDADKLAAGNPGGGPVRIARIDARTLPDGKFVTPVTQHGPSGDVTFLLGTNGTNQVRPIALVNPDPSRAAVPKVVVGPAVEVGFRVGPLGDNPIHRDGMLYFTRDHCVREGDDKCAYNQLQVVRFPARLGADKPGEVSASADPARGFLSLILGPREPDDAPGDLLDYEKPALDVNKAGDVVVVYARKGFRTKRPVPPEVRYSILYHGEAAARPGVLLRAGTTTDVPDVNDNVKAGIDLAFAQVDPGDDHTVWVTHVFADREVGWYKQVAAAVRP